MGVRTAEFGKVHHFRQVNHIGDDGGEADGGEEIRTAFFGERRRPVVPGGSRHGQEVLIRDICGGESTLLLRFCQRATDLRAAGVGGDEEVVAVQTTGGGRLCQGAELLTARAEGCIKVEVANGFLQEGEEVEVGFLHLAEQRLIISVVGDGIGVVVPLTLELVVVLIDTAPTHEAQPFCGLVGEGREGRYTGTLVIRQYAVLDPVRVLTTVGARVPEILAKLAGSGVDELELLGVCQRDVTGQAQDVTLQVGEGFTRLLTILDIFVEVGDLGVVTQLWAEVAADAQVERVTPHRIVVDDALCIHVGIGKIGLRALAAAGHGHGVGDLVARRVEILIGTGLRTESVGLGGIGRIGPPHGYLRTIHFRAPAKLRCSVVDTVTALTIHILELLQHDGLLCDVGTVHRHTETFLTTLLGRDDQGAVGCTGTVECGSGCTAEYVDRFDIVRVDAGDTITTVTTTVGVARREVGVVHRHTVDDHQRLVVTSDGAITAEYYAGRTTHTGRGAGYVQTSHTADQGVGHVQFAGLGEVAGVDLLCGIAQGALVL